MKKTLIALLAPLFLSSNSLAYELGDKMPTLIQGGFMGKVEWANHEGTIFGERRFYDLDFDRYRFPEVHAAFRNCHGENLFFGFIDVLKNKVYLDRNLDGIIDHSYVPKESKLTEDAPSCKKVV